MRKRKSLKPRRTKPTRHYSDDFPAPDAISEIESYDELCCAVEEKS